MGTAIGGAAAALAGALVAGLMQYLKHTARRDGLPDTLEARVVRYDAQSAMQDAMDAVVTDVPDAELRRLARNLVSASLVLGDCDPADLDTVGDLARDTADALRTALAQYLHHA